MPHVGCNGKSFSVRGNNGEARAFKAVMRSFERLNKHTARLGSAARNNLSVNFGGNCLGFNHSSESACRGIDLYAVTLCENPDSVDMVGMFVSNENCGNGFRVNADIAQSRFGFFCADADINENSALRTADICAVPAA